MSKEVAKTSKAAKPAKQPKTAAPRDHKNGITRPGNGALCAKVWEALDKLRAGSKEFTFNAVRGLAD